MLTILFTARKLGKYIIRQKNTPRLIAAIERASKGIHLAQVKYKY